MVLYTSVDSQVAEPIVKDFEKTSGIRVAMLGDTEAAKTTGLVKKLIAEKANPRCDVLWNSELLRTIVLKDLGILAPYKSPNGADLPAEYKDPQGFWHGFAVRARVILFNHKLLPQEGAPKSLKDFGEAKWRGRLCISNPLFGTVTAHMAAVIAALGPEQAADLFRRMRASGVAIVPGNSVVKDLVARGEFAAGLTDSDDAWDAILAGRPVKMIFPDQDGMGTLAFPNSVALIKGGRHEAEARQLIDYLLSKEVERRIAFSPSRNMPVRKDVERPDDVPAITEIKCMSCDFERLAREIESSSKIIKKAFGL